MPPTSLRSAAQQKKFCPPPSRRPGAFRSGLGVGGRSEGVKSAAVTDEAAAERGVGAFGRRRTTSTGPPGARYEVRSQCRRQRKLKGNRAKAVGVSVHAACIASSCSSRIAPRWVNGTLSAAYAGAAPAHRRLHHLPALRDQVERGPAALASCRISQRGDDLYARAIRSLLVVASLFRPPARSSVQATAGPDLRLPGARSPAVPSGRPRPRGVRVDDAAPDKGSLRWTPTCSLAPTHITTSRAQILAAG